MDRQPRPRLLDLFCCAGGAAKGYAEAGFTVVGVDVEPQPHFPFEFHQADAFEFLAEHWQEFDAIHASPPCQDDTLATIQWRKAGKEYPRLIEPTRQALRSTGKPYVIEGVPGAPLINPTMLNGAMFRLRVMRDRLFETSFPVPFFLLPTQEHAVKMGRPWDAGKPGSFYPVGHFSGVCAANEAMRMGWMTQAELSQAIPPAYTQFIGRYLMAEVANRRAVLKPS